jgi:3'-phosphoadenosine 5'-phosphosulfate sulfotransferase (PAPS reductase)/FAD synthetase
MVPADRDRVNTSSAPAFALFSGGHDSLCATHVAMTNGYAQEIVHVNTGIGIEATREFVRETCAEHGWPLNELSPPVSYDDLVLEHGFPGPAGHQFMYRRLKERCLAQFARERKVGRGADALVYCTGVRKQESARRARGQQQEWERAPKLGWTWRAVILEWSKAECNRYIEEHGLRRNPVVDLLHMSGECLCGAFARPGEIEEIRAWFPETAERISQLELRVVDAGHHAAVWGQRPPNVARDQMWLIPPGPLCSSCVSATPVTQSAEPAV